MPPAAPGGIQVTIPMARMLVDVGGECVVYNDEVILQKINPHDFCPLVGKKLFQQFKRK
jgi:hypothetical protein